MVDCNNITHWFNSPYYHILYKHRDETEAESFINNLCERLSLSPGLKVLDVGCGRGRHARILSRKGMYVTGIDISENNITEAKKLHDEKLYFEKWDMRNPYKEKYFDIVVNFFSSFGYFDSEDENLLALKSIVSNLKEYGTLILDYMNSEWTVKNIRQREIVTIENIQFHITRKVQQGYVLKKISFISKSGVHEEFCEKLRIITLDTFKDYFKKANLAVTHLFGDYELNSFDSANSPRMIFVCKLMK
ncbi:MAG: methyltransferase domain-containing protein [Chitinophagales bacterium]|nr:methyltransferase domain-containing protein [Chitinophagales bacterium]MDW8273482.1 methyltransferase domain-containing protein [Chitinophagales bacterium]